MCEYNGHEYKFLEARPGSNYRQWFIKGRRIRAEVIYRHTIGLEPLTPAEVAYELDLPLEAVEAAIAYSIRNPEVLQQDRDREWANLQADERLKPPIVPSDVPSEP